MVIIFFPSNDMQTVVQAADLHGSMPSMDRLDRLLLYPFIAREMESQRRPFRSGRNGFQCKDEVGFHAQLIS